MSGQDPNTGQNLFPLKTSIVENSSRPAFWLQMWTFWEALINKETMYKWFYLNQAVIGPRYQEREESQRLKNKDTAVHLLNVLSNFCVCIP